MVEKFKREENENKEKKLDNLKAKLGDMDNLIKDRRDPYQTYFRKVRTGKMEKRDNLLVKGKSTQTVFRLLCQVSAEGEETEPELLTRGVAKMLTQRKKKCFQVGVGF